MTDEQLIRIKKAFKELERVLESSNTVTGLFNGNPEFEKAFSEAMKGLGILEDEKLHKTPRMFDSRDAIEYALEELEIIEAYVKKSIIPQSGGSLEERLASVKDTLKKVNNRINRKP